MKYDFESLSEEALTNIREDREQTKDLLNDLIKYLGGAEDRHRDVGLTAAKYVETLQRSNEQLVKIAAILNKRKDASESLDEEDKKELFDMIQGGN